jgi:hypothetical protein
LPSVLANTNKRGIFGAKLQCIRDRSDYQHGAMHNIEDRQELPRTL